MTTSVRPPTTLLIAGHWLGAWAWDAVIERLSAAAHPATAITLPGFDAADPDRASRTLNDQADAILATLTRLGVSAEQPAVIVAHSGSNAPVSLVFDRHPELVQRVVWVDSGPVAPGTVFAPDLPADVRELPLPDFDVLAQQASVEGLSPEVLERFRSGAVPVPGAVLRATVTLANDARRAIPTTLVCCSISGAQVQQLLDTGNPMFAEVSTLSDVEIVDLPTGHWPMWSRPQGLADLIHATASRNS